MGSTGAGTAGSVTILIGDSGTAILAPFNFSYYIMNMQVYFRGEFKKGQVRGMEEIIFLPLLMGRLFC